MPIAPQSVLIIGGSGLVGRATAGALRRLHPDLSITIGGRNLAAARLVAEAVGNADVVLIDIERADLGLPPSTTCRAVVIATKDAGLNAMKFAQAKKVPYLSMSDYAAEIGPTIGRFVQYPTHTAVLMMSQYLCGTPAVVAVGATRSFRTVDSVRITGLFDDVDCGGPASLIDRDRSIAHMPSALTLVDGTWKWITSQDGQYKVTGVGGIELVAKQVGYYDVMSLAAATQARTVTIGYLRGISAGRRAGGALSHDVIIEVAGIGKGGEAAHSRLELVDIAGFSAMSGRGAALGIERLLGLAGDPPLPPGLYHPEAVLDPDYVVHRMTEFGTVITST